MGTIAVFLAALLAATPALAQTVRWEDPGTLAAGQRSTLDLVFDGAEPHGGIALPRIDGLTLLGSPSQQSNVTVINGKVSANLTLSYPVRAERAGAVEIPPFEVETSAGTTIVAGLKLDVARPDAAARGAGTGSEVVVAELATSTHQPYAGEVFDVDLTIALAAGRRGEIVGPPAWSKPGVLTEPWGEGQQIKAGGKPAVRRSVRALAPNSGEVQLPPVQQDVRVDNGRQRANPFAKRGGDMFADMDRFFEDSDVASIFGRANLVEATVESNDAALDVRPLPLPAPAGFTGAVGELALESKLVPEHAKTGEPVTWTLTLRGTGNWPAGLAMPARAIPASVRTLQPKQQRHFDEGSLFTGAVSEDLVIIPTQPGTIQLEPVRFTYFDPRTERYETTVVEPPPVSVTGSTIAASTGAGIAPGSSTSPGGEARANSSPEPSFNSLAHAASPDAPPLPADARLPREPQTGVGVALTPMPRSTWYTMLAIPFFLLALYWLGLGLRRAWSTDPQRRRRDALKQIRAAIDRAERAEALETRQEALLAWQHAAAIVLAIDFAAPTPAHLRRHAAIESEWVALWDESDRVLYGRETGLAPGWCERAHSLCRTVRRPWRNPLRALLPSNLVPRLATAALLLAISVPAFADPGGDYSQGDFAAARDAWKQTAEAAPADWIARYNLGLAEAQLGNHGRALGETAAAFLHQPANADVGWNLGVFAARVPGVDRVLARFAAAGDGTALAQLAAPAVWQLLGIAGGCIFCLGGALVLRRLHTADDYRPAGAAVLVAGAIVAVMSWGCLHQYGHLADPGSALLAQASVLRSVPTDAESAQPRKPLEAGAVVVVEKQFLGWSRVALADGEHGWLRSEALVPLYGGSENTGAATVRERSAT